MTVRSVRSRWQPVFDGLRYLAMIILALIFLFPIAFMVVSSFKDDLQILRDSGSLLAFLPTGVLSLENYAEAFGRAPVARFIFNSVIVTTITILLKLLFSSLAGFSLALLEWRGREVILLVIIAGVLTNKGIL